MIHDFREWPRLVTPRKTPARIYLRFGRWSRSINHATGKLERGVSVYRAAFAGGLVTLDWNSNAVKWCIDPNILEGRCVWAVTGREVCTGSDGEPILQGVVARPYSIAIEVYQWVTEC